MFAVSGGSDRAKTFVVCPLVTVKFPKTVGAYRSLVALTLWEPVGIFEMVKAPRRSVHASFVGSDTRETRLPARPSPVAASTIVPVTVPEDWVTVRVAVCDLPYVPVIVTSVGDETVSDVAKNVALVPP
jgi:hypothetical protein